MLEENKTYNNSYAISYIIMVETQSSYRQLSIIHKPLYASYNTVCTTVNHEAKNEYTGSSWKLSLGLLSNCLNY